MIWINQQKTKKIYLEVRGSRARRGKRTVNKRQPVPAGDGSQVTQPSPDPPVSFCERTVARERWHGEWRKPNTIPILLSRLLLSWGLPSSPPWSTITVPPALHCITDWLTDWPTRWLSLLLLLCFILSWLPIHFRPDPLQAPWNVKPLNPSTGSCNALHFNMRPCICIYVLAGV